MSNYPAKNTAPKPGATTMRRHKLWFASGVAGLAGAVGIAAVGLATGAGAVGVDHPSWSTAQVTKDSERAAEDRAGDRNHGRHDERRGREVPCDSDKLIQAIIYANNNHGGVLELARDCTYELTRADDHGNGLPVITERITLRGHDTRIVRDDRADDFRILTVGRGGHLKVKGLTIKGGQTDERKRDGDTPEAVWSRFANSVEATKAAEAGKPYLPLLQAQPKGAVLKPAAKNKPKAPAPRGPAATDGAGVLVQPGGTAEFEETRIEGNQAGGVGGGIANFGKASLYHTTVADNTASRYGGGIFNAGILRVAESTVKDNDAIVGGGGIANGAAFIVRDDIDGGTALIEKTEITGNGVHGFGGGLLDIEGDTTVKHSTIAENLAHLAGGGIAAGGDSDLELKHAKVADNTTAGAGGGLALAFGAIANVEKSEIRANEAGFFGGGVLTVLAAVTFRDSEISGNRAVGPLGIGGGVFTVRGEVDLYATTVSHNFSTIRPGGVFSLRGDVEVDDTSVIKGNKPTNCLGSPGRIENCFG